MKQFRSRFKLDWALVGCWSQLFVGLLFISVCHFFDKILRVLLALVAFRNTNLRAMLALSMENKIRWQGLSSHVLL